MSRFYEIHGAAISLVCTEVRPAEMFRISIQEPLLPIPAPGSPELEALSFVNIVTFRRSCDGKGCFVVEGHKLIDDFNERHRNRSLPEWSLPNFAKQVKAATTQISAIPSQPGFVTMPLSKIAIDTRPHVEIRNGGSVYRFYGQGEWHVKYSASSWQPINGIHVPGDVLKVAAAQIEELPAFHPFL